MSERRRRYLEKRLTGAENLAEMQIVCYVTASVHGVPTLEPYSPDVNIRLVISEHLACLTLRPLREHCNYVCKFRGYLFTVRK